MRGNILYRLINSGVLQSAQFYLFRWLFWRTPSTLKIAKSSPPLGDRTVSIDWVVWHGSMYFVAWGASLDYVFWVVSIDSVLRSISLGWVIWEYFNGLGG